MLHIHDAIRASLASFAAEARGLELALGPGAASGGCQLGSLLERHRFLRAVCSCHSASETEVLFPAARVLAEGTATSMKVSSLAAGLQANGLQRGCSSDLSCVNLILPEHPQAYDDEHDKEAALFDNLGRLLAEVKAFARYCCACRPTGPVFCPVRHLVRSRLRAAVVDVCPDSVQAWCCRSNAADASAGGCR